MESKVWKIYLHFFLAIVLVIISVMASGMPIGAVSNEKFPVNSLVTNDVQPTSTEVWVDDDFTPSTPGWGVTHFAGIQDGIDSVASPGTVRVAEGYYMENIFIWGIDNVKTVYLYGGYSSDFLTRDPFTHVSTINSSSDVNSAISIGQRADNSIIDGFEITGGSYGIFILGESEEVSIYNNNIWGNEAHGIYLDMENYCEEIENNLIHDNSGFGIMFTVPMGPIHIYNNEIWNNDAGGIWAGNGGTLTIDNNIIRDNGGTGIAIDESNTDFISNNIITGNEGAGISVFEESVDITGNTIIDNTGWGIIAQWGAGEIINNLVIKNKGGGIDVSFYSPDKIANNTVAGNEAGGGIDLDTYDSYPIFNNIVWGNTPQDVPDGTVMDYSNIGTGSFTGNGTISLPPLFVDPVNNDYHLLFGSPCIDTGTNTDAPLDDIEGNTRPLDGNGDTIAVTDMGAYEMLLSAVDVSINSPNIVPADTDFPVTLDIGQVYGLHSTQYDIWFDPAVLRLDGISEGQIDSTTFPVSTTTPPQEIAPGHWRVIQSIEPGSVNGSGNLAILHFHTTGAIGTSSVIDITDGVLYGLAGEIPSTWAGDSMEVTAIPGDANGDGVINVLDMTKIARIILGLDDPTPGADANQDGEITEEDMTYVAQMILELIPQPQYGGRLKLTIGNSPLNIGNPDEIANPGDAQVGFTSLEGLMRLDETGELQPWLAESWDVAPDGSWVTFQLRQGVKFHDGTDFNAEAVKYNIDLQINSSVWPQLKSIESCDVVAPYAVRLNFVNGVFNWPAMKALASFWSCMMFSPAALQQLPPETLRMHPVGTGPFRFAEYQQDICVRFDRFNDYWGGAPYLGGVDYYIIPDPVTQLAAYKVGELHAVPVQPADAADLTAQGYDVYENNKSVFNMALIPNSINTSSPFDDVRVRQALEYAIDKQTIVNALTYDYGHASNQPLIEGQQGYNPGVVGYPYNPTIAQQLLWESGYPDGYMTTLMVINDPVAIDIGLIIQSYLDALGIELELDVADPGRYFASLFSTGWQGLIYAGCPAGTAQDPANTLINGPLSGNTTWVSNHEPYDAYMLSQLAATEPDTIARTDMYRDIMEMLTVDNAQQCWLYWTPNLFSLSSIVHGTDFDHSSYAYAHAWLEAGPWGTLRATTAAWIETLDPNLQSDFEYALYEHLIGTDEEGNFIGELATDWSVSENGTVWTYNIREGITFHNGDLLTSADVKFSIERIMEESSMSPWKDHYINTIDHIETQGAYKVLIYTKSVDYMFYNAISGCPILPKNYIEQYGSEYFNEHPVGTGPWRFVELTPSVSIEFEAVPNHWRIVPEWKKLIVELEPVSSIALDKLRNGEIDIVAVSHDEALQMQSEGYELRTFGRPTSPVIPMLGTWGTDGPLSDVRIREALSLAINRQEIADEFFDGFAEPGGVVWTAPTSWGYDPDWTASHYFEYNQAAAISLLAEAGYPGAFADPEITIYSHNMGGTWLPDLHVIVSNYWEAIGVQTEIVPIDGGELRSKMYGAADPTLYGTACIWNMPTMHVSIPFLFSAIHSAGNWQLLHDGTWDALWADITTYPQQSEQISQFRDTVTYFLDQYICPGIVNLYNYYAVSDRVGDFTLSFQHSLWGNFAGIRHK